MRKLNTFQRNNLFTGTHLAVEVPALSSDLRAFVVVGAYVQNQTKLSKPARSLHVSQENLRFWLRRYEVKRHDLEIDKDITETDLLHNIHVRDIQTIEELEYILGKYVQDFSKMEVSWKVANPLP
ncbi:MAG TPA: hypothetical protein VFV38_18400 [Ktedonobacteraceae bacterium]|nr:hypothetical protein [Ktedonobacteraceae bacterium]